MSTEKPQDSQPDAADPPNLMAWTGLAFALISAVLYVLLFFMLHELPASRQELLDVAANAPAVTRLLIVGGSAGLLNVVSLVLCLAGYIMPGRSGVEAVFGIAWSLLMLTAVFSVVIISLLMH